MRQQQKQGEIIGEERDVAHLRPAQAALQQIQQRDQDDAIGEVEDRRAELEKAIEAVEPDARARAAARRTGAGGAPG